MKSTKFAMQVAVVFLLLVAILTPVFAGGGKEVSAQESVTVTVWMGSWWADQIPVIEEAYNSTHTNKVKIEPVPISGYVDKAVASVLGGSPPDVLALDATFIPALVGRNLLVDWNDYADQLDIEDFAGAIWSAGVFGDDIYAVPYRASSEVAYYNKTMLDAIGYPYPTSDWTYADLLAMAKALTVEGQQWGYGMAAASSDPANVVGQLAAIIWSFGGEIMSEDGKTILLTEKPAIEGLKFWADMYTAHKVAPPGSINYSSNDQKDLFLANKVGIFNHADSAAIELAAQSDVEWGLQLVPNKLNRGGGWSYTIPVGAKHIEAAREYVLWFTKSENLAQYAVRMPARPSATTSAPWNSDVYKVFLESARYTRLLPVVPEWTDIQTLWIREMQNVLQGKLTVEQAMANVKREGELLLNK